MSEIRENEGREMAEAKRDEIAELRKANQELERVIGEQTEKAEDYLRRLQYLQAEFDNYRKRVEREKDETSRVIADRLLVSLLEVYDELQIAIDVAKKADDEEVVVSGLEMVLKKLEAIFMKEGLKPIEAQGRKFDPNYHEMVGRVESKDAEGRIVEEVRKGFTLRGKVIRSSLVKVGAAPNGAKDETLSSDE